MSATPAAYEKEHQGQVVEQVVRPTGLVIRSSSRPATTQADDLLVRSSCAWSRRSGSRHRADQAPAEDLTGIPGRERIRVRYLHSHLPTHRRTGRDDHPRPAPGESDVLVGINLLREGLDFPEVSLVAILMRTRRVAFGALSRSRPSARRAPLTARRSSTPTGSPTPMKAAIGETSAAGRADAFNEKANGITPSP